MNQIQSITTFDEPDSDYNYILWTRFSFQPYSINQIQIQTRFFNQISFQPYLINQIQIQPRFD